MIPSYEEFVTESAKTEVMGDVPSGIAKRLVNHLKAVAKEARLKIGPIRVEIPSGRSAYRYQASARTSKGNLIASRTDDETGFIGSYAWIDDRGRLINAAYSPVKLGKWEKSGAALPTQAEIDSFQNKMVDLHARLFGKYSADYYRQKDLENGMFDPESTMFLCGVRSAIQSSIVVNLAKGTVDLGIGYSPNSGGYNGPETQWENRTLRIGKTLQSAEKALSEKLWRELAKPVEAKLDRSRDSFASYMKGKYPNGIPAWPHTPD